MNIRKIQIQELLPALHLAEKYLQKMLHRHILMKASGVSMNLSAMTLSARCLNGRK